MKMKQIIAMVLALVTLTTLCVSLVGCVEEDTAEPVTLPLATTEEEPPLLLPEEVKAVLYTETSVHLSASPMMAVSESGQIEQTLTATVLPVTAKNKTVDWSVSWADGSNTATVTDYVTVTPKTNGSNVATVACKKAFKGNIIVTVTTRESGHTAECLVTFEGKPTGMSVTSPMNEQADGYHAGIGGTYSFNVGLTNPLGEIGDNYKSFSVEVTGVGSMVLGYCEITSGVTTWTDSLDKTVTLDSLKGHFMTATYADGVLKVDTMKTIESYYEKLTRLDGGRTIAYTNKFRSFASDCYFTVKITEKNSGISQTIKIRLDESIPTNVTVSESELQF